MRIIKIGVFILALLMILQIGALPLTLPEATRLQIDVWRAPYSINDYQKDEFDCTNMAALLTDNLNSKGWNNVTLVEGHPDQPPFTVTWHAWVEVDGKYVESTVKQVFFSEILFSRHPHQRRYNSSGEAYQAFSEIWGCEYAEKEWNSTNYSASAA